MKEERFPVSSVIPISQFEFDDDASMLTNNSSGFNYRSIGGMARLSNHAYGRAIDINPWRNPLDKTGVKGEINPTGANYDPTKPGTLTSESSVVKFLKSKGWSWGGDWPDYKDWQHFEKPLPGKSHMDRLTEAK